MSVLHNPEYVTDEIVPTSLTDLEDPIFAIFNDGRFHLPCAGSHTVVQLLAHFQAQAINITHTLLLEDFVSFEDGGPKGVKLGVLPEPRTSALTEEEKEQTLVFLSIIIQGLEIRVGQAMGDYGAEASWAVDRPVPYLPGRCSTITIGSDNLDRINEAFADGNVMAQQYWMFHLAKVIFHELGHVITYAALHTATKGNCYLGNALTCEMGYELEKRLFGGLIDKEHPGAIYGPDSSNQLDFGIVQTEWPCPLVLYNYRTIEGIVGIYTRGPPLPTETIVRRWKVPFAYINRMFQDEFWNNLASPDGLKLSPTVGYILKIRPSSDPTQGLVQIHMNPEVDFIKPHVPAGFVSEGGLLIRG